MSAQPRDSSGIVGGGPGEKAGRRPRRFLPDTEVIGPPECPILHRWTLVKLRGRKLMLHHFLPNADDRAVHDHPASFVTVVLRGYYDDMRPCGYPGCDGDGIMLPDDWPCPRCRGTGVELNERMRPGMVRFRPATHRHRTKVGPRGCWTVVFMGPKRRRWGFWKDGRWYFWRDHELLFGVGMRCPEADR